MTNGLRRSWLYVPCDSERMIGKAGQVPADLLLLNLEDGVSAAKKEEARANAVRALSSRAFGARELVVRINAFSSEQGRKDLSAILPCRPDGICLPKISSPEQIASVDAALRQWEETSGAPPGLTQIHAMIESAAGVLAARDIGLASGRMASLIFGSADYCAAVRCRPGADRQELSLALQMIVTGARAAGIEAVDAPCFDIKNADLLRMEANQARSIGFDGKSALHPGQLQMINEVFDVTAEEMAWAEMVLAELDTAEGKGRALSTLHGHLIDNPHRCAAMRILERARRARG